MVSTENFLFCKRNSGYNDLTITEIYRWFAVSLGFFAQIYFAVKAVILGRCDGLIIFFLQIKKGNIVQLKAFLLLSIITTAFICIRFASIWAQVEDSLWIYH